MTRPPITIVATTFFPAGPGGDERREIAFRAIDSWQDRLRYEGTVRLHIADDGSADPAWATKHVEWFFRDLPVTWSRQERHGVGASLNRGFDVAHRDGGMALYAVDDWELLADFDLTPWADAMVADQTVGMVRFFPHPDLTGQVAMFPSGHGLRIDRHHFAFGHRPALYHPRMREAYGRFAEDVNAYECERLYNENFCRTAGPDIMLALPEGWRPVPGSIELAGIDPREG